MSVEFKDNKSVIGEDAIPQWGSFVNPERWEFIKHVKERLIKSGTLLLTIHLIEETFSPIISPVTKFVYRTSVDQFKEFCRTEGIEIVESYEQRAFIMRAKVPT